MKPILNIFLTLFVYLTWNACSSDKNDSLNELTFAPTTIQGKNLRLSASPDMNEWFIDVYHTTDDLIVTPPDKLWKVKEPYCTYKKIDGNKALFTLEYAIVSSDRTIFHYYELTLSFMSEHGGIYEGVHEYEMDGTESSENCSGHFIFDTKDAPPPSEDDDNQGQVVLSTPTISQITVSSAHIEGNIIAIGISVQEQGVCYGTNQSPTLNDNHKKSTTDNISLDLEGLTENTTYYIRIYAKVAGKIEYGKTTQFTTETKENDEGKTSAIKAKIIKYNLNCNTQKQTITFRGERGEIDKDKTLYIGFCAGTSPQPQVTDISFAEKKVLPYNHSVEHTLTEVKAGTNYYIRPYHIENNKIIYYEETSGQAIGKDIKIEISFDCTDTEMQNGKPTQYKNVNVKCFYEINTKGTYKIIFQRYMPGTINPGPYQTHIGYVENGKYEYIYSASIAHYNTHYKLYIENIETGTIYEAYFLK